MDTNKMRDAFEAWAEPEGYVMDCVWGGNGNHGYEDEDTQYAWGLFKLSWQSSREALVVDLRDSFPLLSAEGLSESDHHCEWSIQQDRKRLHAALDSAQGNADSEVGA